MNLRAQLRFGLAAKLAVCVIASTAAFFTLFGFLNLRMERAQSEQMVKQSAQRIIDVILRSTRYDMLHNDRQALDNVIQELGSEEGIRRIRIFNPQGRMAFSAGPAAGEGSAPPPWKPGAGGLVRILTGRDGRVLSVVQPVANSPECSNADCHVHPPGQAVLGVVAADLSLAAVDRQMAAHQAALSWFLAGAIVFGCLAAMLFMWIAVYKPVRELIAGTHRVAGGDLEYRLPIHTEDELGDLAASFNKMTAQLAGVQSHIEEQVRIKTAELERVHKTLLRSEKMASIGKLAATVAHEINNPLFGILTYARLASRELQKRDVPGREEVVEQLQIIERESKRCGELVKNLLTFSRQAPSHREPNSLNTVVERAVLLVRHKLEMQNVQVIESLAENLPPADCDANQIQQVALVLMVNAGEAMPQGGKLEVSTAMDGGHLLLRVKDTGGGIPESVLPHIFDPFFTTKEDQNRTGLGLAVARSIVEQHAGEISVRSTPGEGTEFTVSLPPAQEGSGLPQPAFAGRGTTRS